MNDRYYVSASPSAWDSSNSWSFTSGGTPGATPPDYLSIALFDRTGTGTCTISSLVNIGGLRLTSPYDGTIIQNAAFLVYDSSGTVMNSGKFASYADSTFHGTAVITKSFACDTTDTTASFSGNLSLTGSAFSTGTLEMLTGSRLICTDATVTNLQIKDSTFGNYVENNGACLVMNNLSLLSGALKDGSNSNVHVFKDLNCYSDFGSMTSNDCLVSFDQSGVNRIFSYGGIMPYVRVDKTNSNPVLCYGGSNLLMNNFVLNDGTFNTNGLDLQVGT